MRDKQEETNIDPLFARAYGVEHNAERGAAVHLTGPRAEQLDGDFVAYLEDRPATPDALEKGRRRAEAGEQGKVESASDDSED